MYTVYWVPDTAVWNYFSRFLDDIPRVQKSISAWLQKFRSDAPKPTVLLEFYYNVDVFWNALVQNNWVLKYISFDPKANLSKLTTKRDALVTAGGNNIDAFTRNVVQWLDALRPPAARQQ
jgi:hypothetical protein